MREVWAQVSSETGLFWRIYPNKKVASQEQAKDPNLVVIFVSRAIAVGQIRQQVMARDEWTCQKCGLALIAATDRFNTAEMDEKESKGTCTEQLDGTWRSGEVSVDNCQAICRKCHTGRGGKHDRHPEWSSVTNHVAL